MCLRNGKNRRLPVVLGGGVWGDPRGVCGGPSLALLPPWPGPGQASRSLGTFLVRTAEVSLPPSLAVPCPHHAAPQPPLPATSPVGTRLPGYKTACLSPCTLTAR